MATKDRRAYIRPSWTVYIDMGDLELSWTDERSTLAVALMAHMFRDSYGPSLIGARAIRSEARCLFTFDTEAHAAQAAEDLATAGDAFKQALVERGLI